MHHVSSHRHFAGPELDKIFTLATRRRATEKTHFFFELSNFV
jgi:hypothetical protein